MSKLRSQRAEQFEIIRKDLKSLGYVTWRVFYDRFMMYRVLIIAINHLAVTTGRDPITTYQSICVAVGRTLRGNQFGKPYVKKSSLKALREEECPHCGKSLFGDLDKLETSEDPEPTVKDPSTPQESPQSQDNEARTSHIECVGE